MLQSLAAAVRPAILGTFIVAAALSAPGTTPAAAQASIKVIVNDQPVTTYAIAQRARLIQLTTKASNATQLATQELIEDVLKLQEAKRMRVEVDDAEVDAAFGTIAERIKLKPDQLKTALKQSGVDSRTLMARLKAQIAWSKVVRQRFNREVLVSEQDVIAALQAKDETVARKTLVFEVYQVVFVVPGKSTDAQVARRKSEAESLRNRFNGCTEGLEFAKSLPEVVVKPLGRRLESDIGPVLTKLLDETPVGRLTPAERTPSGFEMVALCNKQTIDSDAAARRTMEDELMGTEGDLVARRYLRDLRSNASIEYR